MASRGGPIPSGSDGTDYMHRQRIAEHYYISTQNKSRLRYCIFFHYTLFFWMLAKLSADILDRLDIFVLEIEELEIPKPLMWEYIWCAGILSTLVALSAMRRNGVTALRRYMYLTAVFGFGPVIYAAVYYFPDVYTFIETGSADEIAVWQGFPCGVLWYFFIMLAAQVHFFSLYFSSNLLNAWMSKGIKKTR